LVEVQRLSFGESHDAISPRALAERAGRTTPLARRAAALGGAVT
jgi:hypothetical protein